MASANPYQPADVSPPLQPVRRAVGRHWVAFAALIMMGIIVSIPGFALLDQEWSFLPSWQTMPRRTTIHEIEFMGRPISNRRFIIVSLGAGATLVVGGFIAGAVATRNQRHNSRRGKERP